MGLPRTFVGFSSTDILYYRIMLAWKEHKHIDFNFTDCQLRKEINSEDEAYIKRRCRECINMAGKYVMLIGEDTRYKYKYVRWEAEVAIEKGCTIIGVNLDGSRMMVSETCPPIIRDIGGIFVQFSSRIIAYALENYKMPDEYCSEPAPPVTLPSIPQQQTLLEQFFAPQPETLSLPPPPPISLLEKFLAGSQPRDRDPVSFPPFPQQPPSMPTTLREILDRSREVKKDPPKSLGWYYYPDEVYRKLG